MPTERMSMRKLKEVIRLKLECGLKHRQIERAVGVSIGVLRVPATGWLWLDPVIGIVVALHILREALSLGEGDRVGFRVEGLAPAYLFINGRWEDHVLTAITNEDWQAQRTLHA